MLKVGKLILMFKVSVKREQHNGLETKKVNNMNYANIIKILKA